MGIYVFESLHGPYIKVGSLSTLVKPGRSPWDRLRNGGFTGLLHPQDIGPYLHARHFTLRAWYPALTISDEHAAHAFFAAYRSVGEFYPTDILGWVLTYLDEKSTDASKRFPALEIWRMRPRYGLEPIFASLQSPSNRPLDAAAWKSFRYIRATVTRLVVAYAEGPTQPSARIPLPPTFRYSWPFTSNQWYELVRRTMHIDRQCAIPPTITLASVRQPTRTPDDARVPVTIA